LNGLFIVALGVLLLLSNLDILNFWDILHNFWPLIFILWGVSLLLKKRPARGRDYPSPPVSGVDTFHDSKVFGNLFFRSESKDFRGGRISTVFGDCDLDLSAVQVAEGEHDLTVSGVFGDTAIVLPPGAAVMISLSQILGESTLLEQHRSGVSSDSLIMTPDYAQQTRRLKIKISKIFGNTKVG
jgi:predicted membrane protein